MLLDISFTHKNILIDIGVPVNLVECMGQDINRDILSMLKIVVE